MWGISGCAEVLSYPPPKIEVEGHDTTELSGITVRYEYHPSLNGSSYVKLNSPEEVAAYKKQVQFLLKQLDDAERKMAIRTDNE